MNDLNQLPKAILNMDDVRALDRAGERFATPCGAGHLAWRRWGSGPPVLLVHGGSGSWTHWCRTVPALADRHTVWTCDLAGLGDSSDPCDLSHPAGAAEALNIGIRQLFQPSDGLRLVTFSFGCHVSSLAMPTLGDYVRDWLIIGTSALGVAERPVMEFPKERSGMSEAEKREVHRGVLEMLMFADASRIDDLAIDLQAENVAKARFRSRRHSHSDTVKKGVARTTVPLRCIWGDQDVVAYPDVPTVIGILGEHHPELDATVIPDAGHWVMYEQADAFNAALRAKLSD